MPPPLYTALASVRGHSVRIIPEGGGDPGEVIRRNKNFVTVEQSLKEALTIPVMLERYYMYEVIMISTSPER